MVSRWWPVTRSVLRMLIPSTRSWSTSVARSMPRRSGAMGLGGVSVTVTPHDLQRWRWWPLRSLPHLIVGPWQLAHSIVEPFFRWPVR